MTYNIDKESIEEHFRLEVRNQIVAYHDWYRTADHVAWITPLLNCALLTPLCKQLANQDLPRNLRPITTMPDNPPKWLTRVFNEGQTVYTFAPDPKMRRDISHVADWLIAAIDNDEAWLQNVDTNGNPKKLNKIGSLEQAVKEADKALAVYRQQAADRVYIDDAGHEKTVKTFDDGFRIVQLLTPEALDKESAFLSHCIGNGSYDKQLKSRSHIYFSLRDKNGKGHATLEVEAAGYFETAADILGSIFNATARSCFGKLLQCKGKQNRPPVTKYMPYIQEFLKERKFSLLESISRTGLILQDGEYYDINDLPENFLYKGCLDLEGSTITTLPENLRISGWLTLENSDIKELPEGLSVGSSLHLCETSITSLPDNLSVDGYIYLPDHGQALSVENARAWFEQHYPPPKTTIPGPRPHAL